MTSPGTKQKTLSRFSLTLLAVVAICGSGVSPASGKGPALATITGSVKDNKGNPLAGAVIALLSEGANQVIKQTRTAADGSFVATVVPGRYSLRAEANGFTAALFPAVQVRRADELIYKFNLQPVGEGRTAPERRPDRDNAKWRLRSAQSRRSILQAQEGEDATIDAALNDSIADNDPSAESDDPSSDRWNRGTRTQGVVESYFVAPSSAVGPGYVGMNFAVSQPATESLEFVFAGQIGTGPVSPQRLETMARLRVNDHHRLDVSVAGIRRGAYVTEEDGTRKALGQVSMRSVDEWIVREGIVVVLGLDYSRFIGASNASALSPRLGFQFDADARTRIRAAYAPGGDETNVQSVVAFEDSRIVFKQPTAEPVALVDGQAVMEKSRRFELGIERVLDNASTIEATVFFDTTSGRGVGLLSEPLSAFNGAGGLALVNVANQQGAARGVRVLYSRRMSRYLTASAGYSFGVGQRLSASGLSSPADFFESGFFQTVAAQLDTDVAEGTRIHTIFRFSPRATVFAIDPFAGRLAVFDPSLSILVTQELPTFGLPVRAEAIIDARNLLDTQVTADDGETLLIVNQMRRSLRGGISVRF